MAKMKGGQAIVRTLMRHGIDTIFGIPGVQLDHTFDALYEARNSVRTIHTRHEQGAAYMALGYAQSSGKVGACLAVPGPGILNAGAALSTAEGLSMPVLGLTGQIPSYQIGLGLGIPHEIRDQPRALGGIVKWVGRAEGPADVPGVLGEAFRQMLDGRREPVVFEMAPDMMGRTAEVELRDPETDRAELEIDEDALESAARLLGGAEKPAIFVGSGVQGAEPELQRVAELLEAPVVMSPRTGRGALTSRHHLAMGIIEGQELWGEADVVLAVGTHFLSPALAWGREDEIKLVRIDIDADQATKPRPADACIVASAKGGLARLGDRLKADHRERPSRKAELAALKAEVGARLAALEPQRGFATVIRDELPEDGILVTDVTQMATYVQNAMPVYQPRTLLTPGYQSTLGYAFPAGLGAKVAHPDRTVMVITGDGGFMFCVQELATAVQHGIAVITLVFNDSAYGNVKRLQKDNYGARHIAVELHNPDFVALANSFGALGLRATNPDELRAAIRKAVDARGPALIEIPLGELPNIWKLIRRPPSEGVVQGATTGAA